MMSRLYGVMSYMVVMMGIIMVVLVGVNGNSIGANWGTQATHPLEADIVVQMLKDNGIQKVKLFEPDVAALKALGKSGIEVMVGIPNDLLTSLSIDISAAENWVAKNLSSYVSSSGVNVRYVAVGNEPFLKTLNGTYDAMTLPALQNIQSALIKAGLANQVKVTIPLNADVYESSSLPSGGDFRSDIKDLMVQIIKFLNDNACPITINIYPFISLYNDPNFPMDYAFFDGFSSPLNDNGKTYTNVFDANYDTLLWSLEKNGFGNISVIVGEIGWPTDGDKNANPTNARRFNQGLVNHIAQGKGTPMRPTGPIDAYLFSLIDEDDKSILPGNFERHWGIFNYDGTPKYQLNLGLTKSGSSLVPAEGVQYLAKKWCVMSPSANLNDPQIAPSVSYACGNADCTSLGYGTSCGNLDVLGNLSYAYNSYYQEKNQLDSACKFPDGLSFITTKDPSVGTCRFIIQINSETGSRSKSGSYGSGSGSGSGTVRTSARFLLPVLIILMMTL